VPDPSPQPAAAPEPSDRFRLKRGVPDGPPGPWVLLATWGPCGYAPVAPGTAGTLAAVPLFWALRHLRLGIYLLTVAAFIAVACFAAGAAGRYWKVVDASPIVIDEVAGYLVTMALLPWTWGTAIAGFLAFRLFDVWKPWPASYFDRKVKNGFGVVMDDVAAGVWAWAAVALVRLALQHYAGCDGSSPWWCERLP
jgi:phosphatidylglycerophosphatase A